MELNFIKKWFNLSQKFIASPSLYTLDFWNECNDAIIYVSLCLVLYTAFIYLIIYFLSLFLFILSLFFPPQNYVRKMVFNWNNNIVQKKIENPYRANYKSFCNNSLSSYAISDRYYNTVTMILSRKIFIEKKELEVPCIDILVMEHIYNIFTNCKTILSLSFSYIFSLYNNILYISMRVIIFNPARKNGHWKNILHLFCLTYLR